MISIYFYICLYLKKLITHYTNYTYHSKKNYCVESSKKKLYIVKETYIVSDIYK